MSTIICTVGTSTLEKMKPTYLPWKPSEPNILHLGSLLEESYERTCIHFLKNREKGIRQLTDKYLPMLENKYEEDVIKGRHFNEWPDGDDIWRLMPAEVSSTIRIFQNQQEKKAQEVNVILLVSDTPESWLSAQLICKTLRKFGFNVTEEIIDGYQMEKIDILKSKGIANFVRVINNLVKTEKEPIFNITGGYKNFIPLITHISSFYQIDMYYVFEEVVSDESLKSLVRIPNIPTFNTVLRDNKSELIDLITEIPSLTFYDEEDFKSFVYDQMRKKFMGSSSGMLSYSKFVEGFFDYTDSQVSYTLLGKVYLELLSNNFEYGSA